MPAVDWNIKRWGKDFAKFQKEHPGEVYGVHWGDPELEERKGWQKNPGPLRVVVEEFIKPHLSDTATVLEIGSGGGRWTRYLTSAKAVTCVDVNEVFEQALADICKDTEFRFYKTSGYELKEIATKSIDFVFSFGAFVHIEPEGIQQYMVEIERVLKDGGRAVIQYADKTKPVAQANDAFSDMNKEKMEGFVPAGLTIVRHETELLNHSNIIDLKRA